MVLKIGAINPPIFIILKLYPHFIMESAEMDKLWNFASTAENFELKDIVAALNEIQVDYYSCSGVPQLYLSPSAIREGEEKSCK